MLSPHTEICTLLYIHRQSKASNISSTSRAGRGALVGAVAVLGASQALRQRGGSSRRAVRPGRAQHAGSSTHVLASRALSYAHGTGTVAIKTCGAVLALGVDVVAEELLHAVGTATHT